jgi:hypothetical protein
MFRLLWMLKMRWNRRHTELTDGIRAIRESLAAADLKALESLALDNERAAIQHRDN